MGMRRIGFSSGSIRPCRSRWRRLTQAYSACSEDARWMLGLSVPFTDNYTYNLVNDVQLCDAGLLSTAVISLGCFWWKRRSKKEEKKNYPQWEAGYEWAIYRQKMIGLPADGSLHFHHSWWGMVRKPERMEPADRTFNKSLLCLSWAVSLF